MEYNFGTNRERRKNYRRAKLPLEKHKRKFKFEKITRTVFTQPDVWRGEKKTRRKNRACLNSYIQKTSKKITRGRTNSKGEEQNKKHSNLRLLSYVDLFIKIRHISTTLTSFRVFRSKSKSNRIVLTYTTNELKFISTISWTGNNLIPSTIPYNLTFHRIGATQEYFRVNEKTINFHKQETHRHRNPPPAPSTIRN